MAPSTHSHSAYWPPHEPMRSSRPRYSHRHPSALAKHTTLAWGDWPDREHRHRPTARSARLQQRARSLRCTTARPAHARRAPARPQAHAATADLHATHDVHSGCRNRDHRTAQRHQAAAPKPARTLSGLSIPGPGLTRARGGSARSARRSRRTSPGGCRRRPPPGRPAAPGRGA